MAAVEIEEYPRAVLLRGQLDGILPGFPIWDDICTFDGKPFRGKVDIITGGFPCQDISVAGRGAGLSGKRSGLWSEMFRVVCEVRPEWVFVENSPALTYRGLGRVLGNLAEGGYDAQWCVLGADDVGAPHRRKRIWILAHADKLHAQGNVTWGIDSQGREKQGERQAGPCGFASSDLWEQDPADGPAESRVDRMADGVAHRMDRLKAIGNGQVPLVAAIAFTELRRRFEE